MPEERRQPADAAGAAAAPAAAPVAQPRPQAYCASIHPGPRHALPAALVTQIQALEASRTKYLLGPSSVYLGT